jgi:hypothetical protein
MKEKLRVSRHSHHDKRIEIDGADFRVWVDNDDVQLGSLKFARALAKAYNERVEVKQLKAERDRYRPLIERAAAGETIMEDEAREALTR